MKQPIFLRIFSGETLVAVKQYDSTSVVFGKDAQVDVDLGDVSVSNIHAMIEEREGDHYICDLGSKEGTYLNSEKILDSKLNNGDILGIGKFSIEFFIGIPKPKEKPQSLSERMDAPIVPSAEQIRHADEETNMVDGSVKAFQELSEKKEEIVEEKAKSFEEKPEVKITGSIPSAPPQMLLSTDASGSSLAVHSAGLHARKNATFAPKSEYKNLEEIISPGKGLYLQILVAWGDRVIETYRLGKEGVVTLGTHPKNDIVIPAIDGVMQSQPFVKSFQSISQIYIPKSKKIVLYLNKSESIDLATAISRSRVKEMGNFYIVDLQQGEMLKIDFSPNLSLFLTHTKESADVMMVPFGGLKPTELMTVLSAIVLTGVLSLFVAIFGAKTEEVEKPEDVRRVTRFEFKRNEPIPKVERVEISDKEVKEAKTASNVDVQKKEKLQGKEASAKALRPNQNPIRDKMKLASEKKGKPNVKPNVAKGKTAGSGGKPEPKKKNIADLGLIGMFAKGGAQSNLNKVIQGAGQVRGATDKVTGAGGGSGGSGLDSGLKNVSSGGEGEATVGSADIKTKGKNSGLGDYGAGGFGQKGTSNVEIGGEGAEFIGSIDREAIRRVIQANIAQVRACYSEELNKDFSLSGKVVVQWDIVADGVVSRASIKNSTLKNRNVEQCILRRLKTWRFPEPPKGTVAGVAYPFLFSAQ